MESLRYEGGGPRFAKLARAIIYRREDLDAWIESRLRDRANPPRRRKVKPAGAVEGGEGRRP